MAQVILLFYAVLAMGCLGLLFLRRRMSATVAAIVAGSAALGLFGGLGLITGDQTWLIAAVPGALLVALHGSAQWLEYQRRIADIRRRAETRRKSASHQKVVAGPRSWFERSSGSVVAYNGALLFAGSMCAKLLPMVWPSPALFLDAYHRSSNGIASWPLLAVTASILFFGALEVLVGWALGLARRTRGAPWAFGLGFVIWFGYVWLKHPVLWPDSDAQFVIAAVLVPASALAIAVGYWLGLRFPVAGSEVVDAGSSQVDVCRTSASS